MDTRRMVSIGFILSCALGSTAAFAAPCGGATLTTYLTPNFTCTEDNGVLTFKNFLFNGPQIGLNASQINVSPIDVPGEVGFLFSGNFTVPAGQNATYVFSYFIDPPPVIIHGDQIDLDPIMFVSLQADLCTMAFTPNCSGTPLGTLNADSSNPPNSLRASTGLAPTNALGVRNTLTLTGSTNGASSQGFDNVSFVSPEPSGILLAASGLLGLLAYRSRAKLRKIRF